MATNKKGNKRNGGKRNGRNRNAKFVENKTKGLDQELNDVERGDANNRRRLAGSYRDLARDGSNDSSWYALNPQLLQDAGQLSFNNPLGVGLPGIMTGSDLSSLMYTPGVMRIHFLPGIGYSSNNASAVNLAARRIYTFVRHANSGSANYDSPDLMMYLLAVNSAYLTYAQCVRAYGIANVYSMFNRYLPDALLRAAGFDPNDVRSNLADFRYGINIAAAKLGQLAIPSSMKYFKRSAWLVNGVYADSPTAKSQLYVMATDAYYLLEEKTSESGTSLSFHGAQTDTNPRTVASWLQILNNQIAALVESEDIGIMAGDILKAYGSNALMIAPPIAENYVVSPVYNEEVLTQINNANAIGGSPFFGTNWDTSTLNITQNPNTGAIIYTPTFNFGGLFAHPLDYRKPITIRSDFPQPADVMVATRFMMGGTEDTAGGESPQKLSIQNMGTEVVTNYAIYKYGGANWTLNTTEIDGYNWSLTPELLADYSKFDWAPPLYYVTGGDTSENVVSAVVQDWDNVTTIGNPELRKLHETALLSLFNVPSMSGDFS